MGSLDRLISVYVVYSSRMTSPSPLFNVTAFILTYLCKRSKTPRVATSTNPVSCPLPIETEDVSPKLMITIYLSEALDLIYTITSLS